jgi:Flp pilus assembly protein TadB
VSVEPTQERRRGGDRRATEGRRAEDRAARFRDAAATLMAFCGALAVVYVFFALVGAVDFGDTVILTVVAAVLALVWLLGVWQRARSGARFVTRADRERRGF